MQSIRLVVESRRMRSSGNCSRLRQPKVGRPPSLPDRARSQSTSIMVAFKEEFPYLRTDSGQLFEFNRDWLHAAITRAADEAGYPSWWLTDHVTESIAFYLRLRNDENVVAFSQLSQTVRYVLKVIGYKEIVRILTPPPRPFLFRLWTLPVQRAPDTKLRFLIFLKNGFNALIQTGMDNLQL